MNTNSTPGCADNGTTTTCLFSFQAFSPGSEDVSVAFTGDGMTFVNNYNSDYGAVSAQQAATTIAPVVPTSALANQPLTLSASVSVVAPGAGTPSGSVAFSIDGATYSASLAANSAVYTVPAGLSPGLHAIIATYSGDADFAGSASASTLAVVGLVSISINPPSASALIGASVAFNATGSYSDGSTQDLTSSAIWSSSSAVASVSGHVATALALGAATISATDPATGIAARAQLLVKDLAPTTLTYTPSALSCMQGQACSLSAPTSSGGAVVSYSISAALPAGLVFSTSTGAISGAPSVFR
jgi:hypothetical protein